MRQWLANLNENSKKVVLFLWTTFLFVIHFIPGKTLPQESWMSDYYIDKFIHFTVFFLSSLIYTQLILRTRHSKWFLCFLVSPLFFELGQAILTVDRSFETFDLLIDYAAVVVFFMLG